MAEPTSDSYIMARFAATPKVATVALRYGGVDMTIRWTRSGDPDQDMRYLKTLVINLPEVLKKGTEEIYVLDQSRRLEFEIEELFADEDGKGDK